jgi:hypothetical protein
MDRVSESGGSGAGRDRDVARSGSGRLEACGRRPAGDRGIHRCSPDILSGRGPNGGNFDSFRFAAEVSNLDAAVVFYGIAPDETVLAKVEAPIAGFYGEDDPRVMATVRPAEAAMKRLGKTYEVHVYPGATQAFLRSTVEGRNGEAGAGAWPAAIQFLRRHLN